MPRPPRREPDRPAPPSNPLAALRALRDSLPPGPAGPAETEDGASGPGTESRGSAPGKGGSTVVRLRLERRGRGGRTVTRLEGLPAGELEALGRELRRSLGVGASPDGDDLLLQGDLRERAATWLAGRGFGVHVGN